MNQISDENEAAPRGVMRLAFSTFLTASLVAYVSAGSPATKATNRLLPIGHKSLWLASSAGQAAPFDTPFAETGTFISGLGQKHPMPSPDGRWIAFARRGNLWIYGMKDGVCREITNFKEQEMPNGVDWQHDVFVTGWSLDGALLLFQITKAQIVFGDAEITHILPTLEGCKKVRRTNRPPQNFSEDSLGAFVYSLGGGSTWATKLPGTFLSWLPNRNLLIRNKDKKLFLYDPRRMEQIRDFKSENIGQVAPHPRENLALISDAKQIRELDLDTGRERAISPQGEFAQFQGPSYSPDGERIAYLADFRKTLIIDGDPIFQTDLKGLGIAYWWIDSQTLAILYPLSIREHRVKVLDLASKSSIGDYEFK